MKYWGKKKNNNSNVLVSDSLHQKHQWKHQKSIGKQHNKISYLVLMVHVMTPHTLPTALPLIFTGTEFRENRNEMF